MLKIINKTVVDLKRFALLPKILSLVVMALLLSLSLANLTADSVVTTYDDASVKVSLKANDNGTAEDYFLRSNPELSFNEELVPAEVVSLPGRRLQSSVKPAVAVLSLKDIISEIYIPPKNVS